MTTSREPAFVRKMDAAKKTMRLIIAKFPPRFTSDKKAVEYVETVAMHIFKNSLIKWIFYRDHHKENKSATKGKFVMPKNKDIALAACILCALYALNVHEGPPLFPLDAIRASYVYNHEGEKEGIEYAIFKKRVLEFVCILQENSLASVEGTGTIPTFDYGVFLHKILHGNVKPECISRIVNLFNQLIASMIFDSKSPYMICLLTLSHVINIQSCKCNVMLSDTEAVYIESIIEDQCGPVRGHTVMSIKQIADLNDEMVSFHESI